MGIRSLAESMSANAVVLGSDNTLSQGMAESITAGHLRVRAFLLVVLGIVLVASLAVAIGLIISGTGDEDKILFRSGFFLIVILNGAILTIFYDIFVAQGLLETLKSVSDDAERYKMVKAIASRKPSIAEFFVSILKRR